jgi:hypothetical protein
MHFDIKRVFFYLLIGFLMTILTACGSGGGEESDNTLLDDNRPPQAFDQNLTVSKSTTTQDKSVAITLKAKDVDGDTLRYKIIKQPTYGYLQGKAPNLIYTPNPNYIGEDNFVFSVSDGYKTAKATVVITVLDANDAPIAVDDTIDIEEGNPISVNAISNDYDPDNNNTQLRIVSIDYNGSALVRFDSSYIYYSPRDSNKSQEFISYTIEDPGGLHDTATVTINIELKNSIPTANNIDVVTYEDTPIKFNLEGNDIDGDKLNYHLLYHDILPEHGQVSQNESNITYTPNKNYNGTDYLVYVVDDGKVQS